MQPQVEQQVQQAQQMNSEKEWLVTLLLAILIPGIDRMYAGSIGLGILKFITFGGMGLWWLVDIVKLVTGSYKDGDGNPIASK
ncbi:MAG: TM2 domain-containing protein [Candidatus Poseidoniaceae archaeon]|nr:TM2 domain-containing protein [Candidatus Poseidoniaceae archaeon]